MFTGLVESKVQLLRAIDDGPAKKLWFDLGQYSDGVGIGDSIAFNGCCLTVVEINGSELAFEAGSETLARTSLGQLNDGDFANMERSLKVGDRMGGHYVTGHVDGLGVIKKIKTEGEWQFFYISASSSLLAQMASKGSITIDGVSLTLVEVTNEQFSIALIPHTLDVTTLGERRVGDAVNLETDVLAKYVQRQLSFCKQS